MSKKSKKVNKVVKKTSSNKKVAKKKPSIKKKNNKKVVQETVSNIEVVKETISPDLALSCSNTLSSSVAIIMHTPVACAPDNIYSSENKSNDENIFEENTIEQDLADFFKEYFNNMINSVKNLYVAVTTSSYSFYLSVKRFFTNSYMKLKNFLISSDL